MMQIKSTRKIWLHIFIGLLLGSCAALFYISSTDTFRDYVESAIKQKFVADFGLHFDCKLEQIQLFPLKVALSDIYISDTGQYNQKAGQVNNFDAPWSIVVDKAEVNGSWLSLLTHGALKLQMQYDHVVMMELFETSPQKLSDFFVKTLTAVSSSWLVYEGLSVRDGMLFLKRTTDGLYAQIPYTAQLQSGKEAAKVQTYIRDGILWYHQGVAVEKIAGSCLIELPFYQTLQHLSGDVALSYQVHKSGIAIPGFLAGSIQHGRGQCAIKTEDGSIVADPIQLHFKQDQCWCDMRVQASSDIVKYFNLPDVFADFKGYINLDVKVDVFNILNSLQISVLLDQLLYKMKPIFPGGSFAIQDHSSSGCSGVFQMQGKDWLTVDVSVLPGEQKLFVQNLIALDPWFLPGWQINKNSLKIEAFRSDDGRVTGTIKGQVSRIHDSSKQHSLSCDFDYDNGFITLSGTIDHFKLQAKLQCVPEINIENIQLFDESDLLVDISGDRDDGAYITASVDFKFLKQIVPESLKMSFAQEGSFVGRGHLHDGILTTTLQTHYAHIRLPYFYNVIQDFNASCDIDWLQKKVTLKDVVIAWYEGVMKCQQATFWFDGQLRCYSMHVPVMFDKVMLSYHKSMYGLLSGRLLLSKYQYQDPLSVEGKLLLHQAEIFENILSPAFHEVVLSWMHPQSSQRSAVESQSFFNNLKFNIGFLVHDTLSVKTSFMTAKAVIELLLEGTLTKPKVSGQIHIHDGKLNFPYKPIDITGGKIVLMPDQPLDPVIDLTARGKLKKYTIGLRAWGTALDPHIQFESQPYLTEEQILTLLMLGVEDQSLSLMLPAFFTQKLQEIMFGPALSNTRLKSVFDVVLKSMKYVRFLPQFSSQIDRGGIRGIFEIDATQNLHGKIDTNFSQLSDTKIDVDYDVTDDATLRLQKDGPSTYGGEVEFRWKFS